MGMKATPMTKKVGRTVPAVSIGCQAGRACCLNFEFFGSWVGAGSGSAMISETQEINLAEKCHCKDKIKLIKSKSDMHDQKIVNTKSIFSYLQLK